MSLNKDIHSFSSTFNIQEKRKVCNESDHSNNHFMQAIIPKKAKNSSFNKISATKNHKNTRNNMVTTSQSPFTIQNMYLKVMKPLFVERFHNIYAFYAFKQEKTFKSDMYQSF